MANPRLTQVLGRGSTSTPTSSFTALTALGLSAVVTVSAMRQVLLVVKTRVTCTVSNSMITVYLLRDGAVIDSNDYGSVANIAVPQIVVTMDDLPPPGAHTYSVSAGLSSGTGTLSNVASATKLSTLLVLETGSY